MEKMANDLQSSQKVRMYVSELEGTKNVVNLRTNYLDPRAGQVSFETTPKYVPSPSAGRHPVETLNFVLEALGPYFDVDQSQSNTQMLTLVPHLAEEDACGGRFTVSVGLEGARVSLRAKHSVILNTELRATVVDFLNAGETVRTADVIVDLCVRLLTNKKA